MTSFRAIRLGRVGSRAYRAAALLLGLLALFTMSCASGGMDIPPGSGMQDPPGGMPFPAGRAASEQVVLELPGDDAMDISGGASFKGSTLVLQGSSQSSGEFGIFEFSPGEGEPLKLSAEISFGTNAVAYLALANYELGHWELFGDFNSLTPVSVDIAGQPQYISPGGYLYAAVILSGPFALTVESLSLKVEAPVVIPDPNQWPTGAALNWIQQWYLPLNPQGQWGIFGTRDERAWALALVNMTNAARAQSGLPALVYEPRLEALAQAHTRHFTTTGFWSHTNPEGLDPWERLNAIDPPKYNHAGENMAAENESAQEVFDGWMASDEHRQNILNPVVTHFGIGVGLSPNAQFKTGVTMILVQFLEDPLEHNWIEPGESQL